jgi:hypothetical protein
VKRLSQPTKRTIEHLLHATRHSIDVERRAAVDLDREELLPGRPIGE